MRKTFTSAMSVVPRDHFDFVAPQPLQKPTGIRECWRDCATLNKAVLDRQTTPFLKNLLAHPIRAVAPLPDGETPVEPSGSPWLRAYHNVRFPALRLSQMGVFIPPLGRHLGH